MTDARQPYTGGVKNDDRWLSGAEDPAEVVLSSMFKAILTTASHHAK